MSSEDDTRSGPVGPVAVIGLGTFGGTVAADLAGFGHHVLGVDLEEARVNAFADDLAQAVIADARDEAALRDAGVDRCDAVVIAMGENLEATLVGAMNVRTLGVKRIWVKSRSRVHRRILTRIGVDHVVNPEQDIGHRVAQVIHNPFVGDYMNAGAGRSVASLTVPDPLVGQSLSHVRFADRHEVECLGLLRQNVLHRMSSDPEMRRGDVLLLYGRRQAMQRFGERHCG